MNLKKNILIVMIIGAIFPYITTLIIDEKQDIRSINSQKLLELVNRVRKRGYTCNEKHFSPVKPLKWNRTLTKISQIHSDDMFKNRHFGHIGSDKSQVWDRAERLGYSYLEITENILKFNCSEEIAFDLWINSCNHCKNIMNKDCTEIGVSRTGNYWTMVTAKPQN